MNLSGGPYIKHSEWEVAELLKRYRATRLLPRGQRHDAVVRLAQDCGVSDRTIYRWANRKPVPVKVGAYRALFITTRNGLPTRVTSWEKVA